MREAREKHHICVSIDGALSNLRKGDPTVLAVLNLSSYEEGIKELEEMKAKGWEVVRSENCDNYDFSGRCLGHKYFVEVDNETRDSNK